MDRLGPDIYILHCAHAHLKVPGWSLVWNELLTKKLPMFLACSNKMSGGCEKTVDEGLMLETSATLN